MHQPISSDDLETYRQGVARFEQDMKAGLADLKNSSDYVDAEQRWFIEEAFKFVMLQKRYVLYALETYGTCDRSIFLDRLISGQIESLHRLIGELKKGPQK